MKNNKIKKLKIKKIKQNVLDCKKVQFRCPNCKEEVIDKQYLDYYGGVCQKCGYDFYTGWIFL
jgi:ribosomal protein L37AE/L43A